MYIQGGSVVGNILFWRNVTGENPEGFSSPVKDLIWEKEISCEGGRSAARWQIEVLDPRLSNPWLHRQGAGRSLGKGVLEAAEKGAEGGEKNGQVLRDAPVLAA